MAPTAVQELTRKLYSGQIGRRDFIRGMAALGVSASAIGLMLRDARNQGILVASNMLHSASLAATVS